MKLHLICLFINFKRKKITTFPIYNLHIIFRPTQNFSTSITKYKKVNISLTTMIIIFSNNINIYIFMYFVMYFIILKN